MHANMLYVIRNVGKHYDDIESQPFLLLDSEIFNIIV